MKKIRKTTSSPETLREWCEKEAGQPCSNFEWLPLTDLEEHTPDSKTEFLLLAFDSGAAIVYIYDSENSKYIESVSSDEKGHTVIIRWNAGQFLKSYGACKVGEVKLLSNHGSST
ncbi:hypothetical protein LY76DRAFT_599333 [Colletotrichum caudatum]|nr:hypothetical protein LY76DRAFT_599333 [Colletotrichum caudatum]